MIALKDIAYGWKIGIAAVLTGATIYTAGNVRIYLYQRDAVQIIMGTVERAMATQTGTNSDGSAIYAVSPPTLVRNWVTTNGLTGTNFAWITNSLTNTISFYTDHSFMVSLDSTIKALVPYYCDTSSIYDGTTNISMLTVTGLFSSLQIGDHTNQFTAIPCWTNNVGQTNCTTNAATFGPWAWRNYVVAWQERYKVLNALKMTKQHQMAIWKSKGNATWNYYYPGSFGLPQLKAQMESYYTNNAYTPTGTNYSYLGGSFYIFTLLSHYSGPQQANTFGAAMYGAEMVGFVPACTSTQLTCLVQVMYKCETNKYVFFNMPPDVNFSTTNETFSFGGYGLNSDGNYHLIAGTNFGLAIGTFPDWCADVVLTSNSVQDSNSTGKGVGINDDLTIQDWQFNYCTNSGAF